MVSQVKSESTTIFMLAMLRISQWRFICLSMLEVRIFICEVRYFRKIGHRDSEEFDPVVLPNIFIVM